MDPVGSGGVKPKAGAFCKLFTKENIALLELMFPQRDPNFLSSSLANYPGDFIEGLIERLLENNSKVKCEVCWDFFELEGILSCGENGHLFCMDCGKSTLEDKVLDNHDKYMCFFPKCNAELDLPLLERLLEPKMFSKYVQSICHLEVEKCLGLIIEYCPQCNFGVNIEDTEIKVIECGFKYCGAISCRICKKPRHPPGTLCMTDKELQTQHEAENILTEAVVRKCTACGKSYQKFDGCNRIVCKCGAQMCYICKKPVSKTYDHFYNTNEIPSPNQCPLQANSEDLHKMERASAVMGAIKKLDPSNAFKLVSNPIFKD